MSVKPGFWRKCRITLRCVRFAVWFVAVVALLSLAWFNVVGLPDFLKARLVATLREQGVQLEFTRMRWRLIHGLVAENVRIGGKNNPAQPSLTAGEVQLHLDYSALWHGNFQIAGVVVHDGKFTLPVSPTNSLKLLNLRTEVRFLPHDTWSLDEFRADFAGAKILLAGRVAHAPAVTNWAILAGKKAVGRGALTQPLQDFAHTLDKIQFSQPPQFNVRLDGDARDIHSFTLRFNFNAPGVTTPWFSADGLQMAASLAAPADAPTNANPALGFWTNAQPFRLVWNARAAELHVAKLDATKVECDGVWRAPKLTVTQLTARLDDGSMTATAALDTTTRELAFTNNSTFDPHLIQSWLPKPAQRELAAISWTRPPALHVAGALKLPGWTNSTADWRRELNPAAAQLAGGIAFTNATVHGLAVDRAQAHFALAHAVWHATDVQVSQGRTELTLNGQYGMATENFHCRLRGKLNLDSVHPFLPTGPVKRFLNDFQFSEPLALDVDAAGNLRNLISLSATGRLALTHFSLHGQPVGGVAVDFGCTNRVLDWALTQGSTRLEFNCVFGAEPDVLRCRLRGTFDPESLSPFLAAGPAEHELEDFQFSRPLVLDMSAAGNLRDLNSLSAAGHLALTNFSVRKQSIDSVASDFSYTNGVLDFLHPVLFRQDGTQTMTADAIALDFNSRLILFTNGFSTVGPQPVITAIGPKTEEIVSPYDQFLSPPTTLVHGQLPLREIKGPADLKDADMMFKVIRGAPYRVGRFSTTNLLGTMHWRGPWLFLTNLDAALYNGHGKGHATFDFRPVGYGCNFNFGLTVTNVDVRLLAEDLAPDSTNKLEGILSGHAEVTSANSKTWRSWNGYGAAQLQNGLLWNIPIFGLASPLLNAVVPGLGNSRATDASAQFVMTNGVIHSDSLEIHTATMRLEYGGTVDLDQNVNALVTAQLMRNVPLIGSLVSLVLLPVSKVFECQVNGKISDPKVTPIYVPFSKYLLSPVRSFEEIMPSGGKQNDGN